MTTRALEARKLEVSITAPAQGTTSVFGDPAVGVTFQSTCPPGAIDQKRDPRVDHPFRSGRLHGRDCYVAELDFDMCCEVSAAHDEGWEGPRFVRLRT